MARRCLRCHKPQLSHDVGRACPEYVRIAPWWLRALNRLLGLA